MTPCPGFKRIIRAKAERGFLTGISTFGGKAVVYLSDGQVFSSADRELEFASKRIAIIEPSGVAGEMRQLIEALSEGRHPARHPGCRWSRRARRESALQALWGVVGVPSQKSVRRVVGIRRKVSLLPGGTGSVVNRDRSALGALFPKARESSALGRPAVPSNQCFKKRK